MSEPSPAPADDGRHDFDFFFGRWKIANRRLRTRLRGDTRWDEFTALAECHPILGGVGNVDSYDADPYWDGARLRGATLRLFDPATRLWSIYWADDRRVRLDPPVVGRFDGDVGVFVGDDTFEGRPIKFKFTWTRGARVTWQQDFSADGGATWETNWHNVFTRLA